MTLSIPSRDDLARDFLDSLASLIPGRSTARGSDGWRLGRVVSGIAWSIAARLALLDKNLLPDLANEMNLGRWTRLFTFPRKGAAPAQGAQALEVTGTPGTGVPQNAELAHADGTVFKVTTAAGVIGQGGKAIVSIAALTSGAVGNKRLGEELVFSAPPIGIQASATLVKDLASGEDQESLEAWRQRFLARLANPPTGSATPDYLDWLRRVAGVRDAYIYRHRRGKGTVDYVALGTGDGFGAGRVLADLGPTNEAVSGKRPAAALDYLGLSVTEVPVDIDAKIAIDALHFAWDWDDGGSLYTVTAADQGASTITVPTLPVAVVAGKRIAMNGEEALVTARGLGGVLTVQVTDGAWFTVSPVGKKVTASGDLVRPVRQVLRQLFAQLGPARSMWAAHSWEDTLRVARVLATATDVTGVVDAELVTPTANTSPVDPLGISTNLLVPGMVRVRRL